MTEKIAEQILDLAHGYADAKLQRFGSFRIEKPADPEKAFCKLRAAVNAALEPQDEKVAALETEINRLQAALHRATQSMKPAEAQAITREAIAPLTDARIDELVKASRVSFDSKVNSRCLVRLAVEEVMKGHTQ
jgi:poly-gamma-glutamate capsule biosynthesis protein CapA/YwtB (metallophosphatase superfamily)